MTIIEAINRIDDAKPNQYTQSDKVRWLSALDGIVHDEILAVHETDSHEGEDAGAFAGYDDSTDLSTALLVPPPYDEVYVRWLEAQIDYTNGEYARYNNSIAMYNAAYSTFARFYNRTHMPRGGKIQYF